MLFIWALTNDYGTGKSPIILLVNYVVVDYVKATAMTRMKAKVKVMTIVTRET